MQPNVEFLQSGSQSVKRGETFFVLSLVLSLLQAPAGLSGKTSHDSTHAGSDLVGENQHGRPKRFLTGTLSLFSPQSPPVAPPMCRPSPPPQAASWYAGWKSRTRTGTGSFWATRSVCVSPLFAVQSSSVTVLLRLWLQLPHQVVYKEKDSDSAVHFWTVDGNATHSVQLTGLGKYVLYEIQVLAFTRMGDGRPSAPPILERTLDDVPGPPVGILFPEVRTTSVRLIWQSPSEPNGIILGK